MVKEIVAFSGGDRDTFMKVKVNVAVNSDGFFTTTLSKEDVELIASYGVKLETNRTGRPGFFISETMADLISQIHKVLELCVTYKVISRTPVIRYNFKTVCHYCLDGNKIVPNGYYVKGYSGVNWREGNSDNGCFTSTGGYGISIYAKPYIKRTVEYGNGLQKNFYDRGEFDKGSYMQQLNDFGGMDARLQQNLYEMEGTEVNARFFVEIIMSICRFNEQILHLLESNQLENLINSQAKLGIIGNV